MKDTDVQFRKIAIFGAGLIGGSFALAMRRAHPGMEVVGFGRSMETLRLAKELNIIDRMGEDLGREVGTSDLVLLATPVGKMGELMERVAPHLAGNTLVTDGGSTKGDVVSAAYENLGEKVSRFIPAHPIAGAELSGPEAARADLYVGKKVVLTPLPENSGEDVLKVRKAWEACGAIVSELTPKQHDEVFAAVSHLPHLLSFALVHDIAMRSERDLLLSFAASGFRDFTRIAASSPEMWRDICLANRDALLKEIRGYADELYALYQALENNDAAKLENIFSIARDLRSNWNQNRP